MILSRSIFIGLVKADSEQEEKKWGQCISYTVLLRRFAFKGC